MEKISVMCIDNKYFENLLEVGKIYKCVKWSEECNFYYFVINGETYSFNKDRFIYE